jgi:ribosomal protein S18 acetylase RimI-like enzyme
MSLAGLADGKGEHRVMTRATQEHHVMTRATQEHHVMTRATQELEIVFDPLPGAALGELVRQNVIAVNLVRTGVADWHPVGFFLKSPRGEWLGGLTGYIWGGWLHVDFLWVSETFRGQRYGTRLMDAAEAMAQERGAFAATLETFTHQAPDFYAKRGYSVFGRIDDYPPGHAKLYLSKRF